jgi:hypothetical protein
MMDSWLSQSNGRISGSGGSREFKKCILVIRQDPNMVELTIDPIELDKDTVAALRRLMVSRKWKSITMHDTDTSTPQELWDHLVTSAMAQAVRLEVRGGICQQLALSFSTGLRSKK